jgi:hypothetical protein
MYVLCNMFTFHRNALVVVYTVFVIRVQHQEPALSPSYSACTKAEKKRLREQYPINQELNHHAFCEVIK